MANPKQGHYNANKSVSENLNMKTPLLSRFDLCFILKDDHNAAFDDRLSEHVMKQHRHESKRSVQSSYQAATQSNAAPNFSIENYSNLIQRLKKVNDTQNPIPLNVMKDYISYARQYCKPKLTTKAASILQDFYVKLRSKRERGTVPITTRQLESMIRLSQARAKSCLREWVTADDAEDIVQMMMLSVIHVNSDANGEIDTTRGGIAGSSKQGQKKKFLQAMRKAKEQYKVTEFTYRDCLSTAHNILDLGTNLKDILEELRGTDLLQTKNDRGETVWKLLD